MLKAIFTILLGLTLVVFDSNAQDIPCYLGGAQFYENGKILEKYSDSYGGYLRMEKYISKNDFVTIIFNYYSFIGNNSTSGFFMVNDAKTDSVYSDIEKIRFKPVDASSAVRVIAHSVGFKKIILNELQVAKGDSIIINGFFEPTIEKHSHYGPLEERTIGELKDFEFKRTYEDLARVENYIEGDFAIIAGQVQLVNREAKTGIILLIENNLIIPVDSSGHFQIQVKLPQESCFTQIKIGAEGYQPIRMDKVPINKGDSIYASPILKKKKD